MLSSVLTAVMYVATSSHLKSVVSVVVLNQERERILMNAYCLHFVEYRLMDQCIAEEFPLGFDCCFLSSEKIGNAAPTISSVVWRQVLNQDFVEELMVTTVLRPRVYWAEVLLDL